MFARRNEPAAEAGIPRGWQSGVERLGQGGGRRGAGVSQATGTAGSRRPYRGNAVRQAAHHEQHAQDLPPHLAHNTPLINLHRRALEGPHYRTLEC